MGCCYCQVFTRRQNIYFTASRYCQAFILEIFGFNLFWIINLVVLFGLLGSNSWAKLADNPTVFPQV